MSVNNAPAFGAVPAGVSPIGNVGADGAAWRLLPVGSAFVVVGYKVVNGPGRQISDVVLWKGPGERPDDQFGSDADNVVLTAMVPEDAALQADGSVVVVGGFPNGSNYQLGVTRFNADGSWQSNFKTGGLAFDPLSAFATSVAVQPDGKIIVGGWTWSTPTANVAIARFNSDGTVDPSFAGGGAVTIVPTTGGVVEQMQVLPSGKLLVLARSVTFGTNPTAAFDLLRYNANGSLDATFASGGMVQHSLPAGPYSTAGSMLVQADGRIVVAGTETTTDASGDHTSLFVMRFNADGTPDTSFGTQGKQSTPTLTDLTTGTKLVQQSDGKLVIAAEWLNPAVGNLAGVVRFNTDGTLDTTFGDTGIATAPGFVVLRDLALGANDSIVATGQADPHQVGSSAAIVRFNSNGSLDATTDPRDAFAHEAIAQAGGPAVDVLPTAAVFDVEAEQLHSYARATLTLARHGGAVTSDAFGFDGPVTLSGSTVSVSGTPVASVLPSGPGTLKLVFLDVSPSAYGHSAATDLVDPVLQHITWQPGDTPAGTTVGFDWTFNDASGAQNASVTATSTMYVADVLDVGASHILTGTGRGQVLRGSAGSDSLTGSAADDVFVATGGNDTIVGGAGNDTVLFTGTVANFQVRQSGGTWTVTGSNGVTQLTGVERLQFDDAKVALDIDGHAGMAYRLYKAAFDRSPDVAGLGYQANALDSGLTLSQVAGNFIASPEFQAKFGAVTDTQFLTLLYEHVLNREPDAGGLQFHLNELASGQSRADVLTHFSESPENQAKVAGLIEDGILYQ